MTRFFWLREDSTVQPRLNGSLNAAHKWGLPGLAGCPGCGESWASSGHQYPAVDLSVLPEQSAFLKARSEPFPEFSRLRELVKPLAPPGALLPPGTTFGPLEGTASGRFGPFAWLGSSLLLMRDEVLERLRQEGLRGLLGARTALRFRNQDAPVFLEPQLDPRGQLHPDCMPPDLPPRCTTCGRLGFRRPDAPMLDAASLPVDVDLFRIGNFATMIVGTERFMETVRHLELEGISFRELPAR